MSAADGTAVVRLPWRPEFAQVSGLMHGGVMATALDTAMAFALHSLLGAESVHVSLDLRVDYLRPVSSGVLTATGVVERLGERVAHCTARAVNAAGETVAHGAGTYLVRAGGGGAAG